MALSQQVKSGLIDQVLRIAQDCPIKHNNPAHCPLAEIRQLEMPERIKWINAMSDENLSYFAAYHCVCSKLKSKLLPRLDLN